MFIFRFKRRKDEPVSSITINNESKNIHINQITDVHNYGNIDVNNDVTMVDNEIYTNSIDKTDYICIVYNDIYASEIKNNDLPEMVENEIYMQTP